MTRRAGCRDCTYGDQVCNRELESAYSRSVGRQDKIDRTADGDAENAEAGPPARPSKVRADVAVFEQGLAPSRERARALILAGQILCGDRPVDKAGDQLPAGAVLRMRGEPMPYVSRGGLKLAHALDAFQVDVAGAGPPLPRGRVVGLGGKPVPLLAGGGPRLAPPRVFFQGGGGGRVGGGGG